MSYEQIPLDQFSKVFSSLTELSSVATGGEIVFVSDDFFAEAFHLLLVEPAASLKGQFGPKGALYDGWESRRHNPAYDWVIIKLGTTGSLKGFDVDTSHFNGNEAPQASVQALSLPLGEAPPRFDDARWEEVLPKIKLGPNSRHLFTILPTAPVNYVKFNMYPDGGIARFRVYGDVEPIHPSDARELFDAAHVFAGGRVVLTSDQHFGAGANLILPGRGKDMGDGWETKRSRQTDHKDWTIIKLGSPLYISYVVVDTAHFKGNFPQYCEVHAISSLSEIPPHSPSHADEWMLILPRANLGPHREHFFAVENAEGKTFTHIRLTIYPDGGIKRVRVFGSKLPTSRYVHSDTASDAVNAYNSRENDISRPSTRETIALPISPEAFAPFGQVIQSYPDVNATPSPRSIKITSANSGTALKYHKLMLLASSYPEALSATSGISVYRCEPAPNAREVEVKVLERHPYTNQAFIPLGADADQRYIVAVAENGEDDRPNLSSLRAFVVRGDQGVVYDTAVWHLPMTVIDGPMDLACVETQVGNGEPADCETVELVADRVIVKA
ncbi:allantoicase [Vararia minispora EC-137]|uniref:Allantoicase n=1 Tax=Vararia minispora EC-137 TaxID=1314806 RepID=A0ACB8QBG3_9AGAM|nr:allantoicase [Vararia minispora EC-137]